MNYFVFLLIPVALTVLYLVIVMMEVDGFAEERLGFLRRWRGALPRDVNEWKPDVDSPAGRAARAENLVRETRLFVDSTGGWLRRKRLLRQARYVDPATGEVVRAEPDRAVRPWQRLSPRSSAGSGGF